MRLFLACSSIHGTLWGQVMGSAVFNVPEHNLIKFPQNFTSVQWDDSTCFQASRGRMEVLRGALHYVLIPCYLSNLCLVSLFCGEGPGGDSENRLVMAPPSLILLPWECHSSHQGEVRLLAYAICLQTPLSWNSSPKGLCKPPVNSNHYVLLSSNKHRKSI